MHRYRRVQNPGTLPRVVSSTQRSVGVSVSGLTKRGISVCQRAKGHIFGVKPKLRCRQGATLVITGNFLSDKTPASPGAIYRCGWSFMKHVLKCPEQETQTPLRTTSKRNTNLHRNCSPRFAGTNNSSATSVIPWAGAFAGVTTSRGLTWPQVTALHHILN